MSPWYQINSKEQPFVRISFARISPVVVATRLCIFILSFDEILDLIADALLFYNIHTDRRTSSMYQYVNMKNMCKHEIFSRRQGD